MNQRAAYLLQILEKIGSPLMAAITEAAPEGGNAGPQDAQIMASLLAKTVQASIDLGNVMDIDPAEAMDDSLRVALAALAGPIVAGQYRKRGQIPEEAALKRVTGALQAVMAFSENFSSGPENIQRLKELEARGQSADRNQTHVQYVQAFVPVVEAIAEFPFGQAEQKLLMEVSEKLVKKSAELRETLLPGVSDEDGQKRSELGLLRALAEVYSAAHRAETARVMALGENARNTDLSMDPVWRNFDLRTAMLETLAGAVIPDTATGAAQGSGTVRPAAAAPVPVQQPQAASPVAPPPIETQTQPVQPPPPPPQATPATQQTQNPMAMFAKPKTESPPDTPVMTPPPQNVPQESAGDEERQSSGSASPMSFFKKSE